MVKRKAFVGLSGPLFYDYANMMTDKFPNPVLEAPMGLSLLFDEIIFLDERVCPKNMHDLDFIKILSYSELKDYRERLANGFGGDEIPGGSIEVCQYQDPGEIINPIQQKIAPFSKWKEESAETDYFFTPDSYDPVLIVLDEYIANKEIAYSISNSASDQRHRSMFNNLKKTKVIENLISDKIPNYLHEDGPDIDTILEFRNKPNIKQFRDKIDEEVRNEDYKTIEKLSSSLNQEFEYLKDYLLEKHVFKGRVYDVKHSLVTTIGLGIANLAKNSIADPYSLTTKILDAHMDKKYYGWVSFLTQIEKTKKKKNWDKSTQN